jgi:hypothetical protein
VVSLSWENTEEQEAVRKMESAEAEDIARLDERQETERSAWLQPPSIILQVLDIARASLRPSDELDGPIRRSSATHLSLPTDTDTNTNTEARAYPSSPNMIPVISVDDSGVSKVKPTNGTP